MTYPAITAVHPWLFAPQWSSKVTARYEFKTDLFNSRSGREQRRALRNTPRRSLMYSTVAAGDEFRSLGLFLRTNQNQPVAAPEWTRWVFTSATTASLGTVLTFVATPAWMVVGQAVMLLSGSTSHVATITAATGTTVTLDTAVTASWPAGSIVYAALLCSLSATMQAKHLTNAVKTVPVMLEVYPGSEPVADTGSAAITFNGREVFPLTANWANDVSVEHQWPVETVDFGRGRVTDFRPIVFPSQIRKATYLQRDRDEVQALVDFFCRMKGRRGAFYLSSDDDDLLLAATSSSGGSTLTVNAGDWTSLLAADAGGYEDAQEAICIRMRDGTRLYRLVTDVSGSGANRTLTCSGTWPGSMSDATVSGISWMPLVRFASDILELSWLSNAVAETQINFQSIMTEDAA